MSDTRFEVARVTIELQTAHRIGRGQGDDLNDAVFVTDAGGLPALPGSSLAGVMREAVRTQRGQDAADTAFGYQRRREGRTSRVEVSWGQTHAANDRPVPFRNAGPGGDPVLNFLAAGVHRDHVRLNARGVVASRAKFDELVVPAGARFTFELLIRDDAELGAAELVGLLDSEHVRIGGRTRSGLGAFEVVRVEAREFDLSEDYADFCRLPADVAQDVPEGVLRPLKWQRASQVSGVVTATLELTPDDYWIIGGGSESIGGDASADQLPLTERRVLWAQGTGLVSEYRPVAPASSMKGALRHRAAFHCRRLLGHWVGETADAPDPNSHAPDEPSDMITLFGSTKERDREGAAADTAGKVVIGDGQVEGARQGKLQHVSLDRFTQGPIDHALFEEAPLFGGTLVFTLAVRTAGVADDAREAFRLALQDLTEGRLPIGGCSNRGHGYVTGAAKWSDKGRWLEGEA